MEQANSYRKVLDVVCFPQVCAKDFQEIVLLTFLCILQHFPFYMPDSEEEQAILFHLYFLW